MMQHRPGHCVTCDAALKDHTARSLGPPDDSDRFEIGPPPRYGVLFRYPLTTLTVLGASAIVWTWLLALGFRALWRSLLASP